MSKIIKVSLAQQKEAAPRIKALPKKGKPVPVRPELLCSLEQANGAHDEAMRLKQHLGRIARRAAEEGLDVDFAVGEEVRRLRAQERNRALLASRAVKRRNAEQPIRDLITSAVRPKIGTKASTTAGKGVATPSRPRRTVKVLFRRVLENGTALIAHWSRSSQTMLAAVREFCCAKGEWHRGYQKRYCQELQAALSI